MKKMISKAALAAAVLFGVGAVTHTSPVVARPDCSYCYVSYTECVLEKNQSYCGSWAICEEFCGGAKSAVSGTPPAKHNNTDTAVLNTKQTVSLAK